MDKVIGFAIALCEEAYRLFGKVGWVDSAGFMTKVERTMGLVYWVVVTGPGKDRSIKGTEHLLSCSPHAVFNLGVAGALDDSLNNGDILCPKHLISDQGFVDMETSFKAYMDEIVLSCKTGMKKGRLYTSESVLSSPKEKSAILSRTGAMAVDMEAFFIAQECEEKGVKFYVCKAISDGAEEAIPKVISKSVAENGSVNMVHLLSGILLRPWLLKRLISMNREFKQAMFSLELVKSAIIAGFL